MPSRHLRTMQSCLTLDEIVCDIIDAVLETPAGDPSENKWLISITLTELQSVI